MLMPIHDPRLAVYRTPYGAVPAGQTVTLAIDTPRTFAVRDATLTVHTDRGELHILMTRTSAGKLYDRFTATFTPDASGLYFYHFTLCREGGLPYFYGKLRGSPTHPDVTGGVYNAVPIPAWQLTVYDPALDVPAWYGEGVTYQIFPDRFARAGDRPHGIERVNADLPFGCTVSGGISHGITEGRVIQPWDATPDYLRAPDGTLANNNFLGGNLAGIREKLPYLKSLGVTTLYLNPIFAARSNHRYDTADYLTIDPMLGDEADFTALCRDARAYCIRVLLDGVFSHTGADSRYFNRYGTYPEPGAYQSQQSPYYAWYRFRTWPDDYETWWGVKILPCVEETEPSYLDYTVRGEYSVVRYWLRAGASGWRLDVADELPDAFLDALRLAVREENPAAVVIGEVWEDASNKESYGARRRFLLGEQLDGVMNYPLRRAILAYLKGGDAYDFMYDMEELQQNYPAPCFMSLMNVLGTHDTERILTLLGCAHIPDTLDARANHRLTPDERSHGKALLKLATAILYAFPGSPTIYYGDEAGMEGFEDPLCRRGYPWGDEDTELLSWYRLLGTVRAHTDALKRGTLRFVYAGAAVLAFIRETGAERVLCALNRGNTPYTLQIPWDAPTADALLNGHRAYISSGTLSCTLPPISCAWFYSCTSDPSKQERNPL